MELGAYLDSADAEEEHQQPRGPAGLEEEEEQQDKRRRDDEHQRGLGLQLHDLGLGILLPAELGIDDGAAAAVGRSEGAIADVGKSEGAAAAAALAASMVWIRGTVEIELGYRGWKMYRVLNILGWRVKFRGYYCRLPII